MATSRPLTEDAILEFFARVTLIPRQRLDLGSRIVGDLGIAGDDGDDLLKDFEDAFGVPAADFPWKNEFGAEWGLDPISLFLFVRNFLIRSSSLAPRRPLTISDFVEAALIGKWTTSPS